MTYHFKKIWKIVLLIFAVNIAILSLLYTNQLVNKLAKEEEKKVSMWTNAIQKLTQAENNEDVGFLLDIIKENKTIPIILVDENGNISKYDNLDSAAISRDPKYLEKELAAMKSEMPPIEFEYIEGRKNYVYYRNSTLLSQLKVYPYYQIAIISLFLVVSYMAFNASRRSEQSRVWVGLAKETAHQLGTPISSLMAWADIFRTLETPPDPDMLDEMEKDIRRLELVTDRFSKIGSVPVLMDEDIKKVMDRSIAYFRARTSNKVIFEIHADVLHNCFASINLQLFDWVIENLCKNAIDAMDGQGKISITLTETRKKIFIDFSDTGKGMPSQHFKSVFKPGFTTKKRGWGLGLSLAKRIIEDYHKGEIFVKESIINKGTTFRVILQK